MSIKYTNLREGLYQISLQFLCQMPRQVFLHEFSQAFRLLLLIILHSRIEYQNDLLGQDSQLYFPLFLFILKNIKTITQTFSTYI